MKPFIAAMVTFAGLLLLSSPAAACLLGADDPGAATADFIDRQTYATDFGLFTLNARYINDTFAVTHALPTAGQLDEAWITFDFVGDFLDARGSFWGFAWDFREFVSVSHDTGDWMPLGSDGEVDNGSYRLDLTGWLSASAWAGEELLLALKVDNPLGTGDVFLRKTTLYANLSATPVPVPGAAGLLASGLALLGVARNVRRKNGHGA